jgi:triacylglycerol lipase
MFTTKQYKRSVSILLGTAALACTLATSAFAGSAYERGPDPTAASLLAKGSFDVGSYVIQRASAKGYGGATVWFPKSSSQTFGVVSLTPGFLASQAQYKPLAQYIASHGFVVINLDPNSIFDQPDQRAKEMAAALKQVTDMANAGKVPFASVTDVTRRAVAGHSMGGGGTLIAASSDPTLKAAVPLAPWSMVVKRFGQDTVPTLIVACQNDQIAPPKQHADVFYASLPDSTPRGEVEVKGVSHMCSTNVAPDYVDEVSKAVVAWLKRFVDDDMRYDELVKGGINVGDYSRFDVQGF